MARTSGGRRMLVGFLMALSMGVLLYFRIWSLDSSDADSSSGDLDALRRQFERANLEAMDESAEWRLKFDGEVERNRRLEDELLKVKASLAGANMRGTLLHKENAALREEAEFLKKSCNCGDSSTNHRRR